jgi:MFS superfamily sulfate permease-like transporter
MTWATTWAITTLGTTTAAILDFLARWAESLAVLLALVWGCCLVAELSRRSPNSARQPWLGEESDEQVPWLGVPARRWWRIRSSRRLPERE